MKCSWIQCTTPSRAGHRTRDPSVDELAGAPGARAGDLRQGRGATLIDTEDRAYIDRSACWWNVNVGHGRAELGEIAAGQMKRLAYSSLFTSLSHEPATSLAAKLAEMTPGDLGAALFASGGSEANDTAFKLVRYYWRLKGRPERIKIISRHAAYHGLTIAATAATGIPAFWEQFQPLALGFLHVSSPNAYAQATSPSECTRRCAEELEHIIQREGPETVAAFIAEPVQGTGGVIVPPEDYLPRMYEICRRYGVLCIADEVITGFGRLGSFFGVGQWNVFPDIMVVAKGITSGYFPLAAVILRRPLYEELLGLAPDTPFMHGFHLLRASRRVRCCLGQHRHSGARAAPRERRESRPDPSRRPARIAG